MAVEVAPNLFVGDYGDYLDWGAFVVSATKTAHVATLGYAPDADDPNYLSRACQSRLTINWVDGPARLYAYGGVPLFEQAQGRGLPHSPRSHRAAPADHGVGSARPRAWRITA